MRCRLCVTEKYISRIQNTRSSQRLELNENRVTFQLARELKKKNIYIYILKATRSIKGEGIIVKIANFEFLFISTTNPVIHLD
jgi:hypothetical protein